MNEQASESKFNLEGRVAFVSGSSTGLGKATAMSLAANGAKVALNYHNNEARAENTFGEFQSKGYEGLMLRGDVTEEDDVNRMTREIESALGPVDILVVNATPAQPQRPIEQYDWEFFQSMLDFFVKSPYLMTRAALPGMKKRRWGRIINIGSEVFQLGVPNFSAYVAAKGGQSGLTRSLATELAPWGITVNMVSPGWIPVERHDNEPQEAKDSYLATIPARRWGRPDEVGDAVCYLASEGAGFITGQNIALNGGRTVA